MPYHDGTQHRRTPGYISQEILCQAVTMALSLQSFHFTIYWAYEYFFMMGLKSVHAYNKWIMKAVPQLVKQFPNCQCNDTSYRKLRYTTIWRHVASIVWINIESGNGLSPVWFHSANLTVATFCTWDRNKYISVNFGSKYITSTKTAVENVICDSFQASMALKCWISLKPHGIRGKERTVNRMVRTQWDVTLSTNLPICELYRTGKN